MNNVELDIERAVNKATWHVNGKNVWVHRESLKDFMAHSVELPEGLIGDIAYPGGTSTIAAPSGTGKTVTMYLIVKEAICGGIFRDERLTPSRVLIVDYDNPHGVVQKYFKGIYEDYDVNLQIIGREHSPPLLDRKSWEEIPAKEHDIVIIDSFGTATVGISEKEGAKLQQALDTLKMIADKGLAVIVLENTSKNAASYRGRGEKVERVDIFYEARDITDWTPPANACWWQQLPSGDDTSWQDRAARKNQHSHMNVAFVCRKFRWGEEPAPFVIKVDFSTKPWSVSDITETIEQMGKEASEQARREKQILFMHAVAALERRIEELSANGETMSKGQAEDFLRDQGISRKEARNLLTAHDAEHFPSEGKWRLREIPDARGSKIGVYRR